ncbi:MAG TPA: hypothetical protein VGB87_05665, partial [Vicinamibacteria bacterium]
MKEHLASPRRIPFLAVLLSSLASPSFVSSSPAPPVETGSIAGTVRTSDGLPLPGVAVTLEGPAVTRRLT